MSCIVGTASLRSNSISSLGSSECIETRPGELRVRPHLTQEPEGLELTVQVVLELRLQDPLDLPQQARVEPQASVELDATRGHHPEHLQCRHRHRVHPRFGAVYAQEATRRWR